MVATIENLHPFSSHITNVQGQTAGPRPFVVCSIFNDPLLEFYLNVIAPRDDGLLTLRSEVLC